MQSINLKNILKLYEKNNNTRYGLISLNELLINSSPSELEKICTLYGIPVPTVNPDENQKVELIISILTYFYEKFHNTKEISQEYNNPLNCLGDVLYQNLSKSKSPFLFDFPSKSDLIDVFADYCADLGITVYKTSNDKEYNMELYLTKKVKAIISVTEAVYVRTAQEMNIDTYTTLLDDLARSSLVAQWKLFVTTPAAVMKIGFEKILSDMKKLSTWLYIISPRQEQIFGIVKGKRSDAIDSDLQAMYIRNLPRTPLRTPSQVIDISEYEFTEKYAYKPKSYRLFLLDHNFIPNINSPERLVCSEGKYTNLFRSLILIDKNSGLSIYSYSKEQMQDQIISGFLSALDTFVKQLSGASTLEEINYEGFMINANTGNKIKVIAILTESADTAFKERIQSFTVYFEEIFSTEIDKFLKTGNQSVFNFDLIEDMICNMLSI